MRSAGRAANTQYSYNNTWRMLTTARRLSTELPDCVLTVAATTPSDELTATSNFGKGVAIAAPGKTDASGTAA